MNPDQAAQAAQLPRRIIKVRGTLWPDLSLEGPVLSAKPCPLTAFPACPNIVFRRPSGFCRSQVIGVVGSGHGPCCHVQQGGDRCCPLLALAAPGISASPSEDNLRYFNVMILGPAQSPYEGGWAGGPGHAAEPACGLAAASLTP